MTYNQTPLAGAYIIEPNVLGDERGWFMRTYCNNDFATKELNQNWIQMNHSYTKSIGSVRGLHYQNEPFAEIKLVRCIIGKVFDVIVDIRQNSPTFLKWFGAELSAENKKMMYVPKGFAHGFQTLEENCELVYCHSQNYNKEMESALHFNDTSLNINWPLPIGEVSEKDKNHSFLNSNFKGI